MSALRTLFCSARGGYAAAGYDAPNPSFTPHPSYTPNYVAAQDGRNQATRSVNAVGIYSFLF